MRKVLRPNHDRVNVKCCSHVVGQVECSIHGCVGMIMLEEHRPISVVHVEGRRGFRSTPGSGGACLHVACTLRVDNFEGALVHVEESVEDSDNSHYHVYFLVVDEKLNRLLSIVFGLF